MKCTCANGLIAADCPEHVKQVATELLVDKADFAHQLSELIEEYRNTEQLLKDIRSGAEFFEGFARWLKEYK